MAKKQVVIDKSALFSLLTVLLLFLLLLVLASCTTQTQPKMSGNTQIIEMKVEGIDYIPNEFVVERNRPVTFIVDGTDARDCVQYFSVPELGINEKLKAGPNIYEFTPTKPGDIVFSCSMGMVSGKIKVVDTLDEKTQTNKENQQIKSNSRFLSTEDLVIDKMVGKAQSSTIVDLKDGDSYDIIISPVKKIINGKEITMLAYNGMIPGPALRVEKNSKVKINVFNDINQNTTIHWHGLRHDIKDDGVPGVSQDSIIAQGKHTYTLFFPDAGIFWYHPHIREDVQQESGLAANIIVEPLSIDYYNPINYEELLVLDDISLSDQGLEGFGKVHATKALMGRFGNVMLINGKEDYSLSIKKASVVRFYITNVANVRPFRFTIPGARMKLVGSDLSKYEHETHIDSIIIAPAERYIIEVFFEKEGVYEILNQNPLGSTRLGSISVDEDSIEKNHQKEFDTPRTNNEVISDIDQFRAYFNKPTDYELDLNVKIKGMGNGMMNGMMGGGMMMHQEETIEWEDTMPMMNNRFDTSVVEWIIKDKKTGKENMDFMMDVKTGDKIKIRLVNEKKSMHPMQHPIHLHGQRFLVLDQNGKKNENLVWKDTVLIPIGEYVDILVDVTNPGEWMLHCHIAEHLEAGMMTSFTVEDDSVEVIRS